MATPATDSNQLINGVKTWVESDTQAARPQRHRAVAGQRQPDDDLGRILFELQGAHQPARLRIPGQAATSPSPTGPRPAAWSPAAPSPTSSVVENYASDRDADLYSAGWNTAYDGHNGWKGFVDLSWSRTDRTDDCLQTYRGHRAWTQRRQDDDISFDLDRPRSGIRRQLLFRSVADQADRHEGWGWFRPDRQAGYDNLRKTRDD